MGVERDDRFTVIRRNDDGDVSVSVISRSLLEERLSEAYYGVTEWLAQVPDADPNSWPGDSVGIIIQGVPVTPTKIETVTRWELP